MASKSFKKKKSHDIEKAFYALELYENGEENEHIKRDVRRGVSLDLSDYTIDYAQFCHQPLSHVALDFVVTALKVPEFLLFRMSHKVIDKVKELADEEPEEIVPGLPSGHCSIMEAIEFGEQWKGWGMDQFVHYTKVKKNQFVQELA